MDGHSPGTTHAEHGHQTQHVRMSIPLPMVDNAGVPFPETDVHWFEGELLKLNSGYRKHLYTRGAWNNHGTCADEPTVVYVITLEEHRLPDLIHLLDHSRIVFRQHEIWAEYHDVTVIQLAARSHDHNHAPPPSIRSHSAVTHRMR